MKRGWLKWGLRQVPRFIKGTIPDTINHSLDVRDSARTIRHMTSKRNIEQRAETYGEAVEKVAQTERIVKAVTRTARKASD